MDFDTFLPLAMNMKQAKQDLDIRFVTFSRRHYNYLRENRTLMAGVAQCGSLHCFPTDGTKWIDLIWNAATGFITMAWWVIRRPRPLLFRERAFREGSAARLYLLSRLRRGAAAVVLKTRIVESSMIPEQVKEFSSKIPSAVKTSYIDWLFGRSADYLIQTHDDQTIFTQIYAKEFMDKPNRILRSGLMTESEVWQELIHQDAQRERESLLKSTNTSSRRIYVLMGGKTMQSRWLRSEYSVEHSFTVAVNTIFSKNPNALVLVRPHPAGMDEPFIKQAIEKYGADRVQINLAHPDAQAILAHRVIFTAPTNVMSTLTLGRRIDCIEYTDDYLATYGEESPCRRYGVAYANPAASDFSTKFGDLLMNDNAFDAALIDAAGAAFFQRNKPDPGGLLKRLGAF